MRGSVKEKVKGKVILASEAYLKIRNYCAYQERSHREVKQKLFSFGLRSSEVDEILARLITDGFLNEERFAKAFAGGKFRMKKWGRIKIQNELEMLGLTPRCVKKGLDEIDASDYRQTLQTLLKKKAETIEEDDTFKVKNRLSRFAIAKGYEPELVWSLLKDMFD